MSEKTLRDEFAMLVMQADISSQTSETGYVDFRNDEGMFAMATLYYKMADAMLKAREA
jgi:hypothetical protein